MAHLTRRGKVKPGSELFGRAFEHLIYMELTAHSGYSEVNYPIACWKTASGFEVDFVIGEHEIAADVKSTDMVTIKHLKGIRAFKEEYQARRYIVVSMDTNPRRTEDGIEILIRGRYFWIAFGLTKSLIFDGIQSGIFVGDGNALPALLEESEENLNI